MGNAASRPGALFDGGCQRPYEQRSIRRAHPGLSGAACRQFSAPDHGAGDSIPCRGQSAGHAGGCRKNSRGCFFHSGEKSNRIGHIFRRRQSFLKKFPLFLLHFQPLSGIILERDITHYKTKIFQKNIFHDRIRLD